MQGKCAKSNVYPAMSGFNKLRGNRAGGWETWAISTLSVAIALAAPTRDTDRSGISQFDSQNPGSFDGADASAD
jgi:hypothetical protein